MTSIATSPLTVTLADGVATLAMDDGKANVMSEAMTAALVDGLAQARAAKAIVVITGRPSVFSGGFDLGVFKGEDNAAKLRMLAGGARLAQTMLAHPQPIITVCAGHAMAMGAFVVASADVRIAVDTGMVIQANEVAIGMTVPYFAIEACRQRLSPNALHAATAFSQPFNPSQALAAGFFDEITAAAELANATAAAIARIKKLHLASFAATKARLREAQAVVMQQAVDKDMAAWGKMLGV